MRLISKSEMEDFEAAILGAGFKVEDFNVVELKDEPAAKVTHAITGTVTVHRLSNDEAITYSAGHLSTWVSEFEIDLLEDKFGQP